MPGSDSRPRDTLSAPAINRRSQAAPEYSEDLREVDGRPGWRTIRRQTRVRDVLRHRQPDLTVVLENLHDPHNAAAVFRSCDATGVPAVHSIQTRQERFPEFKRTIAASATKWVEHRQHDSVAGCFDALHAAGFTILATALQPDSLSLYDVDLTRPVALVFGNEMHGVSEDVLALADGTVFIPMMGMVESLNISVACAVSLYEAMRQRRAVGAYAEPKYDEATLAALEAEWLRR